jgi:hypothetical protein
VVHPYPACLSVDRLAECNAPPRTAGICLPAWLPACRSIRASERDAATEQLGDRGLWPQACQSIRASEHAAAT